MCPLRNPKEINSEILQRWLVLDMALSSGTSLECCLVVLHGLLVFSIKASLCLNLAPHTLNEKHTFLN